MDKYGRQVPMNSRGIQESKIRSSRRTNTHFKKPIGGSYRDPGEECVSTAECNMGLPDEPYWCIHDPGGEWNCHNKCDWQTHGNCHSPCDIYWCDFTYESGASGYYYQYIYGFMQQGGEQSGLCRYGDTVWYKCSGDGLPELGCQDTNATNYDPDAEGPCVSNSGIVNWCCNYYGCVDDTSCNQTFVNGVPARVDDGSCIYPEDNYHSHDCEQDSFPDLGDWDCKCWCKNGKSHGNVGDCDQAGTFWESIFVWEGSGSRCEDQCRTWCAGITGCGNTSSMEGPDSDKAF